MLAAMMHFLFRRYFLLVFYFLHISFLPHPCASSSVLSDDTLRNLPRPGNDFDIHDGALLAPILIPRVPGTPGSEAVLNHFVQFFQSSLPQWDIAFQNSTSVTPSSQGAEVPFRNLIVSRDPPWASAGDTSRLTLVAHYDSKVDPAGFIGATDSAAPCAMIMHAARSIDGALSRKWDSMKDEGLDAMGDIEGDRGIQLMFLDGEEAFVSWTQADSIYGARSLAEEWDKTPNPAMSAHKTKLQTISLFVLLDLLGAKDPLMSSYFRTTHWAYQNMAGLETRLRKLGQFASEGRNWFYEADKDAHAATSLFQSHAMQDDHLPFLDRGVEVLHLIPFPFPSVWHRMEDDGEHLDAPSVEDWALLTTAFAAEWLDLEGFLDLDTPSTNPRAEKRSQAQTSKTEL
jgi:glutaminyl-peptide cyclotransferase